MSKVSINEVGSPNRLSLGSGQVFRYHLLNLSIDVAPIKVSLLLLNKLGIVRDLSTKLDGGHLVVVQITKDLIDSLQVTFPGFSTESGHAHHSMMNINPSNSEPLRVAEPPAAPLNQWVQPRTTAAQTQTTNHRVTFSSTPN